MNPILLVCLCSFLNGWMVTGLVLIYARRRLLDLPNERSSHSRPTPRGGGMGTVVGLLAGWVLAAILLHDWSCTPLLFATILMAVIGFWDDHVPLPARIRLTAQAVSVAVAMWVLWHLPMAASIGVFHLSLGVVPWIALPFTLFGAIWIVNLTNFMDGIDGIAGSHAAIVLGTYALWLERAGDPLFASLMGAAAAASLGFLFWNWPPARIFMGDVGSTVVGLMIAIGIIRLVQTGHPVEIVFLPHLPFFLDATVTLGRRFLRRERLSTPHRSHLYQQLARAHGRHLGVTVAYAAASLLGAGIGEWALRTGTSPTLALAIWLVVAGMILLVMLKTRPSQGSQPGSGPAPA